MTELRTILERQNGTVWSPKPPASEADLDAVEKALGLHLSDEYRKLLAYSSGGALYGAGGDVIFFTVRDLTEFNPDQDHPDLVEMLLFADDQGDFFFYFDPRNQLGRGEWAVFGVEKSVASRQWSRYVARDLGELVSKVLGGQGLLEGPVLGP